MKHLAPQKKKPRRIARAVLHIELALILVCGVALLLCYLEARRKDPVLADAVYPPLAEYLVSGVVLAAGTFVLAICLSARANAKAVDRKSRRESQAEANFRKTLSFSAFRFSVMRDA